MSLISVSILNANLINLAQEIELIEQAGVDMLHLDIMDGHFVPNLTFGTMVVSAAKRFTKLKLDVHLMIEKPELYIKSYIDAGADIITVHPESTVHLDRTIALIKTLGCKAGVALLPTTTVNCLEYIIDKLDLILVMTVNPGFGGQIFLENQISKINSIAQLIKNKDIILSVDGGINQHTAKVTLKAGATMLVSGSYIFNSNDYGKAIDELRQL